MHSGPYRTSDQRAQNVDSEAVRRAGNGNLPPSREEGDEPRPKVARRIPSCLRQWSEQTDERGYRETDQQQGHVSGRKSRVSPVDQ